MQVINSAYCECSEEPCYALYGHAIVIYFETFYGSKGSRNVMTMHYVGLTSTGGGGTRSKLFTKNCETLLNIWLHVTWYLLILTFVFSNVYHIIFKSLCLHEEYWSWHLKFM